jgi:hypothetical protein
VIVCLWRRTDECNHSRTLFGFSVFFLLLFFVTAPLPVRPGREKLSKGPCALRLGFLFAGYGADAGDGVLVLVLVVLVLLKAGQAPGVCPPPTALHRAAQQPPATCAIAMAGSCVPLSYQCS